VHSSGIQNLLTLGDRSRQCRKLRAMREDVDMLFAAAEILIYKFFDLLDVGGGSQSVADFFFRSNQFGEIFP
jgi:hypothetical protein